MEGEDLPSMGWVDAWRVFCRSQSASVSIVVVVERVVGCVDAGRELGIMHVADYWSEVPLEDLEEREMLI